jgi:NitT/TauT family transport system substrate-binding protein
MPFPRLVICAALLLVMLGGGAAPRADAQTAEIATLRIAATSEDDVTPILYAQQAGLFERAGLRVSVQRVSSGAAIAAAVVAGSYDVGKSAVLPLMNAHLKGLPLAIIAPGGVYDDKAPFAQLVVAEASPYHAAKDLNGKVFSGAAIHDIGQLASSAWIDAHGGDSSTLHFIELPQSAAGEALVAGRVDATTLLGAQLQNIMEHGQVRALGPSFGAIAPHFLFSAWFTTQDFADKHPEIVVKFSRIVAQAAAYTNAHHAQTASLIAAFTSISPATIDKMTRAICGDVVRTADIQPFIDTAAKYHFIEHGFPASDLVDPAVLAR